LICTSFTSEIVLDGCQRKWFYVIYYATKSDAGINMTAKENTNPNI
jgi:hypothetical protein